MGTSFGLFTKYLANVHVLKFGLHGDMRHKYFELRTHCRNTFSSHKLYHMAVRIFLFSVSSLYLLKIFYCLRCFYFADTCCRIRFNLYITHPITFHCTITFNYQSLLCFINSSRFSATVSSQQLSSFCCREL